MPERCHPSNSGQRFTSNLAGRIPCGTEEDPLGSPSRREEARSYIQGLGSCRRGRDLRRGSVKHAKAKDLWEAYPFPEANSREAAFPSRLGAIPIVWRKQSS